MAVNLLTILCKYIAAMIDKPVKPVLCYREISLLMHICVSQTKTNTNLVHRVF